MVVTIPYLVSADFKTVVVEVKDLDVAVSVHVCGDIGTADGLVPRKAFCDWTIDLLDIQARYPRSAKLVVDNSQLGGARSVDGAFIITLDGPQGQRGLRIDDEQLVAWFVRMQALPVHTSAARPYPPPLAADSNIAFGAWAVVHDGQSVLRSRPSHCCPNHDGSDLLAIDTTELRSLVPLHSESQPDQMGISSAVQWDQ